MDKLAKLSRRPLHRVLAGLTTFFCNILLFVNQMLSQTRNALFRQLAATIIGSVVGTFDDISIPQHHTLAPFVGLNTFLLDSYSEWAVELLAISLRLRIFQ